MTRVFADLHHLGLYHSFQLLFEKRLGWELYRPIGTDWFTNGYWQIAKPYANNPSTVAQYLEIRQEPLNNVDEIYKINKGAKLEDGIYHCSDGTTAITLDKFAQMKFDVVIASIPDHFESFDRLIKRYQPQAKLVCHFGNVLWNIADYPYKNIMASVAPQKTPEGYNTIYYHQEFEKDIFSFTPASSLTNINSFNHTMMVNPLFAQDWQYFLALEKEMSEYKFKSYGAGCRDGVIDPDEVAPLMKDTTWGFHLKTGGDGYGYVIHEWFAMGRPPIVKLSQYKGQLAEQLMIDGKTCIDIDGLNPNEAASKIRQLSPKYQEMSEAAHQRFNEIVNFDEEEQELRAFLSRLI